MKEQVLSILDALTQTQRDKLLIDAIVRNNPQLFEIAFLTGADISVRKNKAICWASEKGHTKIVEMLIGAKVDVHAQNDEAIYLASKKGHMEIVKMLIRAGADIEARNGAPISYAADYGDIEVVQLLLKAGANVNGKNGNPICVASRSSNIELVKLLIKNGADVNAQEGTPIWLSAINGNIELAKLLIQAGADVNLPDNEPIRVAAREDHPEVALLLLKAGADVYANLPRHDSLIWWATARRYNDIVELLFEMGLSIDNHEAKEAFIHAIEKGYSEIVDIFVKNHFDVTIRNNIAIYFACSRENIEIVKMLLKAGADVNAYADVAPHCTLILWATARRYNDIVELLFEMGLSPNEPDVKQAFALAIEKRYSEIVETFIRNNFDITANNNAAIYSACSRGYNEIIKMLLKAGADVNGNGGNSSPLRTALENRHAETVKLLIQSGAVVSSEIRSQFDPFLRMAMTINPPYTVETVHFVLEK